VKNESDEDKRRSIWAREVREKIEEGWQQSERGEMLDGEAVFRRLKKALEERGDEKRTKDPRG
jgi:hypothetical protein